MATQKLRLDEALGLTLPFYRDIIYVSSIILNAYIVSTIARSEGLFMVFLGRQSDLTLPDDL